MVDAQVAKCRRSMPVPICRVMKRPRLRRTYQPILDRLMPQ